MTFIRIPMPQAGAALACAAAVLAQAPHASAAVVVVGPPIVRVEPIPGPRPGWIWTAGYWRWSGRGYVWVAGTWVAARPGYVYAPAHGIGPNGDGRRGLGPRRLFVVPNPR